MIHEATTRKATRRRWVVVLVTLVAFAGIWWLGRWLQGGSTSSRAGALPILSPTDSGSAPKVTGGVTTAPVSVPTPTPGLASAPGSASEKRSGATSSDNSGRVVPWAQWTFARGEPSTWTALRDVGLTTASDGLDVRTTTGESDYQLMSSPVVLGQGDYSLRLTAAIRYGGMEVGLLDVGTNTWMSRSRYASSQGTDTRAIVVPFTLSTQKTIRLILSNWMPGQGQSRWRILRARLDQGLEPASAEANANALGLPTTGAASFGTTPLAELPLAPNLQKVLPAAKAAMRGPGTTWAKATQIRTLVRETMPVGSSCGQVATAYLKVGLHAGLAVRLVAGTANGTNGYDTHETASVWLPEEHRWAISDPTFNGYWSVGKNPVPIGVETLRRYITTGREDEIYWHQTTSRNAIKPSSYYVDPLALYRYTGVQARIDGANVYLVWDPPFSTWGVYQVPHANTDTIPPGQTVTVRKVPANPGSTSGFPMPPPYLQRRVAETHLVVDESGHGRVKLHWHGKAAITVPTQMGKWALTEPDGTRFPLSLIGGGELSPIVAIDDSSTVSVTGANPGTYLVHVWLPTRFPKAHELGS